MNTNNVNTAAQESSERWGKIKHTLTARFLRQSGKITALPQPVTDKKAKQQLMFQLTSFAKTRAALDVHHWAVHQRTDVRLLTVWKQTRSHVLDCLDNADRRLCQALERRYHQALLSHQAPSMTLTDHQ